SRCLNANWCHYDECRKPNRAGRVYRTGGALAAFDGQRSGQSNDLRRFEGRRPIRSRGYPISGGGRHSASGQRFGARLERLGFSDSFGMKLTLNGQVCDVERRASLSNLLASVQMAEKLVLVELNGRAIPRANFSATKLADADTIEIVRLVGGG